MTKRPRTLTAAFVRTVSRPGVYGDGRGGRGLSLRGHRTKSGRISRTWRQRLRIEGRLTSVGLGPYPEITLAEARRKALDNSRAVRHGGDPRGRGVPTFAEAAERTIELHRDGWKAGSPLPEQWEATFRLHAASLLDKPVDRITSADVLACLAAIWNSKPGAAKKARHRIAAVFRWSIGKNLRPDNPVDRAVVALPRTNGNAPRHYRALPHGEVAASLGAIRRVKYIHPSAVLCVEMIALTAVRAGEARGALWDEIDLEAGAWTIPASRMKAGREFCVPLSTGALGVLERARALSPESSLVFPSRKGGVLARNAPGRVLRRAGIASTVHGFRSSARSWMAESGVPAEVAEACLAHVPRSRVVQAYQRSDLLERRAEVMQAWCDYVTQQ
ncbi:MAG: site-specific integrase [Gemmatimonadetes bacterium]|nr:site-specific integrase [Gemmatimonadota bacterium]